LQDSGTYTAVVSDIGSDNEGAYTLQLDKIYPAVGVPELRIDVPQTQEINPGTDLDPFVFSGNAGSVFRLTILSGTEGYDPRVEVYDPSGIQVTKAGCGSRSCGIGGCSYYKCSASADLSLPLSGSYTVVASDIGSDGSGSYTLSVQCLQGDCSYTGNPSPLPSTAALENPGDGQIVAGVSLIRGWAFGPPANPVSSITLLIDGKEIGIVPFGSGRGDVAATFPDQPNAKNSGFGVTWNYGLLSPGPHTIDVRVRSQNGSSQLITRQVTVVKFAGFEFVDGDLSTATTRKEGNEVVIEGVQVRDTESGQTQTVTVRLRFDQASQGFVVTDIQ
jgi:hypothetical protein